MKLFVDTANLADIKRLASYGILDGVTTNPTLIAKEGVSLETRIKEICEVVSGPVSSEVVTLDPKEMIAQGKIYAGWAPNVYVKLPMTPAGLIALQELNKEGIKTNVTLVFTANQALLAAKAGATLMSPFIGRLDDRGQEGMALIEEIVDIYDNYDYETQVLVASIRSPRHVVNAALLGADIATIPADIFDKMFEHPLTTSGQEQFLADWEKVKNKQ
ncbi:fructose-6-phosphate aldolase [Candidatus Peregrinibacteria bacterium CG11_big_fil_rev_8_21_14_0_20_41_10]|nr:MAG: fructose-6-phosphate aldolase [Candidatus Peregrinibacteria bacterium CG11_big_fil_rev_8_21_14_0_20_41_10]PJC38064.1 MAG: fructose-6-phosphate aldolase [Candidatus Peregrinibacteria bacterium CG_4_9_14_0_2_um_filter_41_14]